MKNNQNKNNNIINYLNNILKNHITKLKNFLRDVPDNLKFNEIEDDADILLYNQFGNIFTLDIVDQGEGYTSPPKLTIDKPKGSYYGFEAKAVAFIVTVLSVITACIPEPPANVSVSAVL